MSTLPNSPSAGAASEDIGSGFLDSSQASAEEKPSGSVQQLAEGCAGCRTEGTEEQVAGALRMSGPAVHTKSQKTSALGRGWGLSTLPPETHWSCGAGTGGKSTHGGADTHLADSGCVQGRATLLPRATAHGLRAAA